MRPDFVEIGLIFFCEKKMNVHSTAASGFSASNVDKYNRGRPDYPVEAVVYIDSLLDTALSANARVGEAADIIELGSGTGKFTQSFISHTERPWLQLDHYVATEPSEAFRENLARGIPGIVCLGGTGEQIPRPELSADAVIVAQAFHWMDNDRTLQEVHRVLRPSCPLIMVWNTDMTSGIVDEIDRLVLDAYYTPDIPRYKKGGWERCFQGEIGSRLFAPLQYMRFHRDRHMTEEQILDRVLSVSVVAVLEERQQAEIRERVSQIIRSHQTNEQGLYTVPCATDVFFALKI